MEKYYDFKLGKNHLRGYGWQGLVALVILLIFVVAIFNTLAIPAKPAGTWLFQFLNRLLGT